MESGVFLKMFTIDLVGRRYVLFLCICVVEGYFQGWIAVGLRLLELLLPDAEELSRLPAPDVLERELRVDMLLDMPLSVNAHTNTGEEYERKWIKNICQSSTKWKYGLDSCLICLM